MENKITNYCSKNKETHQICRPLHRQSTKCTVAFGAPVFKRQTPRDVAVQDPAGMVVLRCSTVFLLPAICPVLCLGSSETCALAREITLAARGHLAHFWLHDELAFISQVSSYSLNSQDYTYSNYNESLRAKRQRSDNWTKKGEALQQWYNVRMAKHEGTCGVNALGRNIHTTARAERQTWQHWSSTGATPGSAESWNQSQKGLGWKGS